MNSFRLGVFDIFAYIIPGIVYLILISLALNIITPEQFTNKISSLTIYSMLGYFFLAYLLGFAFETIASKYCNFFIRLIKGNFKNRVIERFNSDNPETKLKDYNFYTYMPLQMSILR